MRAAAVLAVVLASAFLINLDSSIVNVALPSMARELRASTSSLQWFVDAYNLALASLVLVGGNIGDRYGRRETLTAGLGIFTVGSVAAAFCTSSGQLIGARFVMGAGAAMIFPTTLSIISATFPDRDARTRAIGAWAAVTGVGFATGPLVGGALLERFWWGVVFTALIPVAVLALLGTLRFVPSTRAENAPPLDLPGLALSVAMLGVLVYSIIEAPDVGWLAARTLGGFAAAVLLGAIFVTVERGCAAPMIDLSLFANPRFSAASGSVTVAYFALFGFSFLVTQYFQGLRHYSPLGTGVRVLPIAVAVAVFSGIGARLALSIGNKLVVAAGMLLLGIAFAWIAFATARTDYVIVAAEMVLLGAGLGCVSAPATEAIMGVVRPGQAGAGSAVNDATRELGGTLGVAVLGSIFASLYAGAFAGGALRDLPASLRETASTSLPAGQQVVEHLPAGVPPAQVDRLSGALGDAFLSGLHAASWTAMGVCLAGAVAVMLLLPARPLAHSAAQVVDEPGAQARAGPPESAPAPR